MRSLEHSDMYSQRRVSSVKERQKGARCDICVALRHFREDLVKVVPRLRVHSTPVPSLTITEQEAKVRLRSSSTRRTSVNRTLGYGAPQHLLQLLEGSVCTLVARVVLNVTNGKAEDCVRLEHANVSSVDGVNGGEKAAENGFLEDTLSLQLSGNGIAMGLDLAPEVLEVGVSIPSYDTVPIRASEHMRGVTFVCSCVLCHHYHREDR